MVMTILWINTLVTQASACKLKDKNYLWHIMMYLTNITVIQQYDDIMIIKIENQII